MTVDYLEARNEGDEGAQKTEWIRPFSIAWRHKWIIVASVLLCLSLGYAYCVYAPPKYESSAHILVVKKQPRGLPMPGMDPRLSTFES